MIDYYTLGDHSYLQMSKQFYITTAIDYVNGHPHLGHAYEKVIADVIARVHGSLGKEVYYLTGLDEHGQKVQQAAQAAKKDPQDYCDELSVIWKSFVEKLGITNNEFIRTSEDRHTRVVRAILSKLHEEGHFYKAEYRGYYSTKEETFLTEKDRGDDGKFDPVYGEVVDLVEENYYFKLKDHQQWLIEYIERNPEFVYPPNRRNEVLGFLKNNELGDLCISRPLSRLGWGIPLPFDPNYVTYVWFDALVNYISLPASKGDPTINAAIPSNDSPVGKTVNCWPADVHVIGKDILKFHTIYWPIMLKAMGLDLPKQVVVHGFWQKNGQKISKAIGNIVDPISVIEQWGIDAFRYYVVRELEIGPDGNWTDEGFASRYQAELANGLGNLVNRSLSMLNRYNKGIVPPIAFDLRDEASKIILDVKDHLGNHRLQAGLVSIWNLVGRTNQYIDQTAPFKIAKDENQKERLGEILYNITEVCRLLAILIWPIIPETARKIFKQLGLDGIPNDFSLAEWGRMNEGHQIGKPSPLFPRVETILGT